LDSKGRVSQIVYYPSSSRGSQRPSKGHRYSADPIKRSRTQTCEGGLSGHLGAGHLVICRFFVLQRHNPIHRWSW
jgi:hypothetical protein